VKIVHVSPFVTARGDQLVALAAARLFHDVADKRRRVPAAAHGFVNEDIFEKPKPLPRVEIVFSEVEAGRGYLTPVLVNGEPQPLRARWSLVNLHRGHLPMAGMLRRALPTVNGPVRPGASRSIFYAWAAGPGVDRRSRCPIASRTEPSHF